MTLLPEIAVMKRAWADYIVFSLCVLLIFLLLFRESIEVPNLLVIAGRMHPVVLHFPIVLIILAVIRTMRSGHPGTAFLAITTILTLVTALSGLLLYAENTGQSTVLNNHMWVGSALAFTVSVWFWIDGYRVHSAVRHSLIGSIAILVLATGHLGGTVTHGEDFLTVPSTPKSVAPGGDPEIFSSFVHPLFESKCQSCHHPGKMKGGLLLNGLPAMLKGGDSGPALIAGSPAESLLLQRMMLPADDEHHMPPAGKAQPSEKEIELVRAWIAEGAPDSLLYSELDSSSPLYIVVAEMMNGNGNPEDRWSELSSVSEKEIKALTNEYRTIKRVWGMGDALSVSIFPHQNYTADMVTQLGEVRDNIVQLDLSGLPLGARELEWIGQCQALDRLDLDHTPVDDKMLAALSSAASIRHLKLHHTAITDQSVALLASLPSLERVYLYNSGMSTTGLADLRNRRPDIYLESAVDVSAYTADIDTAQSPDPASATDDADE